MLSYLITILVALFLCSSAFVNLFINKAEMRRILGVESKLDYIVDGKVNHYPMKFTFRINGEINTVTFSWNSTHSIKVDYSLLVFSDDNAVIPLLSIPNVGRLPIKTEKFVIEYNCIGNKAGMFAINFHLNFTWTNGRTELVVKQHKLCVSLDDRSPLISGQTIYGFNGKSINSNQEPMITHDQIFYLSIGIVLAIVILMGSLVVTYFKSAERPISYPTVDNSFNCTVQTRPGSRSSNGKYSGITDRSNGNHARLFCSGNAPETRLAHMESHSELTPASRPIIIDHRPTVDMETALKRLSYVPRDQVHLQQIHLEGTFGQVRWALRHDTTEKDRSETLMIKMLKSSADQFHLNRFLMDGLLFHNVPSHDHIAQVDFVSNSHSARHSPMLCYIHRQGWGNLKKFLLRCRGEDGEAGVPRSLRTQELVLMAVQLASGLAHLHRSDLLHTDVAIRNCLVNSQLAVRLCDSSLSRDLFPNDYHCLGDNENRPIKWLSQETLRSYRFTSASDVWAFGVTVWELLTCAQQPYPDIDPDEMYAALCGGTRPTQPYNCPDELFGVMYCCWHHYDIARPSIEQLHLALEDFLTQLQQFI